MINSKEASMSRSGTVNDYMSRELITFTPDTDIHRAIKVLLTNRISGAPVLGEAGRLVGVLTKKDCLKIAFGASYHKEWGGHVSDFMTADVETVDAQADIVEVAEMFLKVQFHRYPVMRKNRVVGVITRHDVLRALNELW
jgi:CBS domain-containing protein